MTDDHKDTGAGVDGAAYGNPGGTPDSADPNTRIGAGNLGDTPAGRPDTGDAVSGDGEWIQDKGPFGNTMSDRGVTEFGEDFTDGEGANDEQ